MAEVMLVDHQPAWPAQFQRAAAAIEAVFAGVPVRLEHIGSTAVPGLCAKPVLDLLLGVPHLEAVERRIDALVALGYVYRPGYETALPERRYFVRAAETGREAGLALPRLHLHAVVTGGGFWRRHLAFRDALRAEPALAAAYAHLKRDLARRHAHDKAAYQAGKDGFIVREEARAPAGLAARPACAASDAPAHRP